MRNIHLHKITAEHYLDIQIAIPYSAVLDVERSSAMDFSETIEVKVVDNEDKFAVDSYFFAYFQDIAGALDQIRDAVRMYRTLNSVPEPGTPPIVVDTTIARTPSSPERTTTGIEPVSPRASSGFRLSSLFRPFSDSNSAARVSAPAITDPRSEEYTHILRKPGSSSFVPITTSPKPMEPPLHRPGADPVQGGTMQSTQSLPTPEHTYPPSTSSSSIYPNHSSLSRDSSSSWAVGVPSWLKAPRKVFGGSTATTETHAIYNAGPVKEMYSSAASSAGPVSRSSGLGDLAFSVLDTPDMLPDQEATDKFRASFAYDERETLLGCAYFIILLDPP